MKWFRSELNGGFTGGGSSAASVDLSLSLTVLLQWAAPAALRRGPAAKSADGGLLRVFQVAGGNADHYILLPNTPR